MGFPKRHPIDNCFVQNNCCCRKCVECVAATAAVASERVRGCHNGCCKNDAIHNCIDWFHDIDAGGHGNAGNHRGDCRIGDGIGEDYVKKLNDNVERLRERQRRQRNSICGPKFCRPIQWCTFGLLLLLNANGCAAEPQHQQPCESRVLDELPPDPVNIYRKTLYIRRRYSRLPVLVLLLRVWEKLFVLQYFSRWKIRFERVSWVDTLNDVGWGCGNG